MNYALHVMALSQIRSATPGQAYYRAKTAAGKSDKEAMRCLKRRLADAVFHQLHQSIPTPLPLIA